MFKMKSSAQYSVQQKYAHTCITVFPRYVWLFSLVNWVW